LIADLLPRVEALEKQKGLTPKKIPTPTRKLETILEFPTATDVSSYLDRNDKLWLFGPTWGARVEKNRIFITYYEPLSEGEMEIFKKSKDPTPEKLCRFDQYYSKQIAVVENKFDIAAFKFIHP